MSVYNCKYDGDQYRVSKFSPDLEVESSYLVSAEACDCPAGHRHTCRHRQMLPLFEAKGATRGQYFLDFDRKVWLPAVADVEFEQEAAPEGAQAGSEVPTDEEIMANLDNLPIYAPGTAAHGFTMLDLANPLATHNAIAAALDEPIIEPRPKSSLRRI